MMINKNEMYIFPNLKSFSIRKIHWFSFCKRKLFVIINLSLKAFKNINMRPINFHPRTKRCVIVFIVILLTITLVYLISGRTSPSPDSFTKSPHSNSNAEDSYLKTGSQCTFNGKLSDESIPELPVGRARYDNKRMLRIYDFHFTGVQWESLVTKYDICFATQASIERIYWIPYILERWTGPLSLALQLTSDEEWLIFNLYTSYLIKCYPAFLNQVAIHLAVPANLAVLKVDDGLLSQWEGITLKEILEKGETCPEAKGYLKYLLDTLPTKDKGKLKYKEVYPQNHMRNIGRKGCGTHWTYSADVDIIPRDGMADMLQKFYEDLKTKRKLCDKCAYIIPTFEMKETRKFPRSKKEVCELFKKRAAHQYNVKVYAPAQDATDYKLWTSTNIEEGSVTISHKVTKNTTYFEPFYVSPDNIPEFDERFLGYGFTRSSQFKAAITAGWNFSVLTPVFSIHWGVQTTKNYQVPRKDGVGKSVRLDQNKLNRKFYDKFVEELEFKKKIGML